LKNEVGGKKRAILISHLITVLSCERTLSRKEGEDENNKEIVGRNFIGVGYWDCDCGSKNSSSRGYEHRCAGPVLARRDSGLI
jgi:hypothetical protein